MPSWIVPSDTHIVGDSGHTTDHNHVADDLTLINNAAPVVSGGLTGAVAATRFAGATTSGAPASGTFAVGDFVVDQTGSFWVCTTAGSPGTWAHVSGGGGSGTVTSVSVTSANGFAGSVATATTTPAITISTTVTGLLKGNGTAVSAATAGTDYLAPSGNGSALTGLTESQISGLVSDLAAKLPIAGGTMTGWLAPAVATLTFVGAGTTLVNAALGNAFNLTLTASTTTLGNPSNPVDGQVIRFRITQGAGGSFTLAYGTAYDFGAGVAPTLSTTAAKVDILGFEYVASISKWCYVGSGLGF